MKRNLQRIPALTLCVCLIITCAPMTGFAAANQKTLQGVAFEPFVEVVREETLTPVQDSSREDENDSGTNENGKEKTNADDADRPEPGGVIFAPFHEVEKLCLTVKTTGVGDEDMQGYRTTVTFGGNDYVFEHFEKDDEGNYVSSREVTLENDPDESYEQEAPEVQGYICLKSDFDDRKDPETGKSREWIFTNHYVRAYTLKYAAGDGVPEIEDEMIAAGTDAAAKVLNKTPERAGYLFTGWYEDAQLSKPVSAENGLIMEADRTVYAGWAKILPVYLPFIQTEPLVSGPDEPQTVDDADIDKTDVDESGIGEEQSDDTQDPALEKAEESVEQVPDGGSAAEKLNMDDHNAYIVGYPDGSVRPEAEITRAETAAVFYRLLNDETRSRMAGTENPFDDVNAGDWFNEAVSTMANGGIIKGYGDGTFRPQNPVTRAEFACIAARFDPSGNLSESVFSDISGHWAEKEIMKAESLGYVKGYDDGTFRPDDPITRAEAMTLINHVLDRDRVTADGLIDGKMRVWPDNTDKKAWYYAAVQEATNTHTYVKKETGEKWTGVK